MPYFDFDGDFLRVATDTTNKANVIRIDEFVTPPGGDDVKKLVLQAGEILTIEQKLTNGELENVIELT